MVKINTGLLSIGHNQLAEELFATTQRLTLRRRHHLESNQITIHTTKRKKSKLTERLIAGKPFSTNGWTAFRRSHALLVFSISGIFTWSTENKSPRRVNRDAFSEDVSRRMLTHEVWNPGQNESNTPSSWPIRIKISTIVLATSSQTGGGKTGCKWAEFVTVLVKSWSSEEFSRRDWLATLAYWHQTIFNNTSSTRKSCNILQSASLAYLQQHGISVAISARLSNSEWKGYDRTNIDICRYRQIQITDCTRAISKYL